ncbi:MAG: Trp family transcriptional regulator [Myxococcota bacterium]
MDKPSLPPDLLAVLASIQSDSDLSKVLMDLLTPSEIEAVGERWAIVKGLASGQSQRAVRDAVGCSVTTVSRGNRQLRYGEGGFTLAFEALGRLGYAVPGSAS